MQILGPMEAGNDSRCAKVYSTSSHQTILSKWVHLFETLPPLCYINLYYIIDRSIPLTPQWGTADAEIKNPPGGSQGLSKVPSV